MSAHLKHREVMLKRAHGALADAGCVVPIELDKSIEHAIHALAERAITAEERLEQMTRERDREREEWASRRCECSASDSCKMARERDEARERVLDAALIHAELVRERDEARAQLAAIDTGSPCDGHRHCCADRRKLAEELLRVRTERDNAQLTFESCNRARRLAEEECDALKEKL